MYRRYYRSRKDKYSSENVSIHCVMEQDIPVNSTFPTNPSPDPQQGTVPKGIVVVPATNVYGVRKVKNFNLKITTNYCTSPLLGILVYVPEGTTPQNLNIGGEHQSIYEPNQNVIASFIIPPTAIRDGDGAVAAIVPTNPITINTKLARNLASGDYIVLMFANLTSTVAGSTSAKPPFSIDGVVNFAIKY